LKSIGRCTSVYQDEKIENLDAGCGFLMWLMVIIIALDSGALFRQAVRMNIEERMNQAERPLGFVLCPPS
jgi:hypothetical protein